MPTGIRRAFTILAIAVFSLIGTSTEAQETDGQTALGRDELFEAVARARRPAETMRVSWHYLSPERESVYSRGDPPPPPRVFESDASVVFSGNRSRFHEVFREFAPEDLEVPVRSFERDWAFDGISWRTMTTFVDQPDRTPDTLIGPIDNSAGMVALRLFGDGIRFDDPDYLRIFDEIRIDDSNAPVYIVDFPQTNGADMRVTIDANRSFNVVRVERFFAGNHMGLEEVSEFEQMESGEWFLSSRQQVRHRRDGTSIVEEIVEVLSIELDIDVDSELFTLEFPRDATRFDQVTGRKMPSAAEFAADALAGVEATATDSGIGVDAEATTNDTAQSPSEAADASTPRSSRPRGIGAAVAGVLLLAVLVMAAFRTRKNT